MRIIKNVQNKRCTGISMQGLNKNERKLLELQITQCKYPIGGVDVIMMSKFNTPKNVIKFHQMYTK